MKTHNQYCGIARAVDILGPRWTLLILRELLLGPRRYSELYGFLPGITTNLLAKRLRELERNGLVHNRRRTADNRRAWELTDLGRSTRSLLLELGSFGARFMGEPRDNEYVRARWFVFSLQRRFRGRPERGSVVEFEIDGEMYTATIGPAGLEARDGSAEQADLRVRGTLAAVSSLFNAKSHSSSPVMEGDRRVFTELIRGLE